MEDILRCGKLARNGRNAERRERRGKQFLGFRIMPGAVAETDGVIQTFGRDIDAVVVGRQPDLDERITLPEFGKAWQQPTHRKCADRTERQHITQMPFLETLDHIGHAIERILECRQKCQPILGNHQSTRKTPEQFNAEALLQKLYLVADGRLRDAEFYRRASEAEMPGGGLEGAQGVKRKVRADHGKTNFNSCLKADIIICPEQTSWPRTAAPQPNGERPMTIRWHIGILFCSVMTVAYAHSGTAVAAEPVQCTVILDEESGDTLYRKGQCDEAFAPQSTFKLPLAMMGYDAGILTDETQPRWAYQAKFKRPKREQQATDPTIWEKDSIVWYSQEITRRLGEKKFADYVKRFGYGNGNVKGVAGQTDGLTESWLMSSLKISADEQAEFVRRFLNGRLPISEQAYDKTLAIIPKFSAADGWQVQGKTGSGRMRTKAGKFDGDSWLGWFVGWAQKGDRRVVFATMNVKDWKGEEPISVATRDALIADLPKLVK